MDRDTLKAFRRGELLTRLELLNEMIKEQASRAEVVREVGWDATPYEERSKLLTVTRQQHLLLLWELLGSGQAHADDRGEAPAARPSEG